MQEIVHKFTKNIPGHVKPDASHVLGFETAQAGIYPKHSKETMPFIFCLHNKEFTPTETAIFEFQI